MRSRTLGRLSIGLIVSILGLTIGAVIPSRGAGTANPIEHIVILYLENQSFDGVLGKLCVTDNRCNGRTTGKTSTGLTLNLRRAPDIVPVMDHSTEGQRRAINGGRMNGFDRLKKCEPPEYKCYIQYHPDQIPNLASLARTFTIHDRLFSLDPVPSWAAHLELVAATLDGFEGTNPTKGRGKPGNGWGCDSYRDAKWKASPAAPAVLVPSCVPKQDGTGPYRSSPVKWVPTIMDRMTAAGVPWKIYHGPPGDGYSWSICPTFANCIYGPQKNNMAVVDTFTQDAAAGRLPAVSFITPRNADSQHNGASMLRGDNFIGSIVSSVMNSPYWESSVIIITYDDCGCFYDHVAPPVGKGIRMPTVIVSPYAKRGFTDSKTASFPSLLALIERTFGLLPLNNADRNAYGFENSFDFTQPATAPLKMQVSEVPLDSIEYVRTHPQDPDDLT